MKETNEGRISRKLLFVQSLMGLGAYASVVLPYVRQIRGLEKLDHRKRYLFVANHVSLLDTILLGGICWRAGCYPILVLGDKVVWHASRLKRMLSTPIGFLLERGKLNPGRVRELEAFGRAGGVGGFHLVVFPEGTRGNGVDIAPFQPGLYYIAQAARLPIVPLYFQNMQLVSTKTGGFHAVTGLRKVEVHFGEPIPPEVYQPLAREEFSGFIRQGIVALQPPQSAAHWNPVPRQA